jgi:hypothetical protein
VELLIQKFAMLKKYVALHSEKIGIFAGSGVLWLLSKKKMMNEYIVM